MNVSYDFSGKTALVTGAGKGMGLAGVNAFAAAGAAIAMIDRDVEALEKEAARLTEAGHRVLPIPCDVSDEAQVKAAIGRTVSELGGLDMAFNNAGIQADATELADVTMDDYDRMLAINLRGIFACMKYELAHMRENGGGATVNNSSLGGFVGNPGRAAYHASKHGIHGLVKSAGLEYAPRGIRINAVAPGTIDTPMVRHMLEAEPDAMDEIRKSIPIDRLGKPEEIAAAVLWLCSDAASYVVGAILPVDGSYIAR